MTNQQAPEALHPIARYKIGYAADSWGMRSSTPSGIPDHAGAWVRYEDHVAALVEAQQPDAHVQNPAEIAHVAGDVSKNGAESNMAQRPAPSAAAALPEGWVPLVITHEGQYPEEVAYGPQILMDRLGKWLRKYFDHVVASKAQPAPTPQADSAPSAAAAGEVPLPLLVRDIAADLGTTPIQVCKALAQLGFGGHSVNMVVTPRMAKSLRAHFASTTPQADSAPVAICNACGAELLEVKQSPNSYLSAEQFDADKLGDWYCKCCPKGPSEGSSTHRYFWNRDLGASAPQADSQPAPDDFQPCPSCFGTGVEGDADDYGRTIDVTCGDCNGSGRAKVKDAAKPKTATSRYRDECTLGGRCLGGCLSTEPCYHALRAASAPADSVTAPAGVTVAVGAQEFDLADTGARFTTADMATACGQAFREGRATPPAQAANSVLEDAARWQEHVGKLDALVAYCPTCCQGFIAQKEMTRDDVLFACGKAVGQSGAKRLREALDLAVDHIDMDALRISHCKDAAVIDAARKQGANHD